MSVGACPVPLEAECERPGTVAELCRDGVAFGIAAAIHVARPNLALPEGALVATVAPEAYDGLGVGVMDLNR